MTAKQFPLHSTGRTIPWGVAERAYEVYSKRYGTSQSLERLAQRGGFGGGELDDMIPGWREEVEEIYLLRKEVERLRDGIQKALDNKEARAWILEHTLLNGEGDCCGGRCQGHGTKDTP